jgi:hypothetical protein
VVFERNLRAVTALNRDGGGKWSNHAIRDAIALDVMAEVGVRVGVASLNESKDVVAVQFGGEVAHADSPFG